MVGMHKEDISVRESKMRYEVLKGASRKSELSEGEGSEFIGLGKINTGSEQCIFGSVGFKYERAKLIPAGRGNDKKSVKEAMVGARMSGLPDSSAREGRKTLGREVEKGEGRYGSASGPE